MKINHVGAFCIGAAALALSVGACGGSSYSRISDGARSVAEIKDVPDRCESLADESQKQNCQNMRVEARQFVSGIEALQQICLEGNPLGNGITSKCVVRAAVEDVDLRGFRVKIRETYPDSGFKVMDDYWFSNDAMVDIYLYSMGFVKNSDITHEGGAGESK